jgi:SAM-dependent methyltransferase
LDSRSPIDAIPPVLSRDAFVGTAKFYSQYRPPYPKALLSDLLVRAQTPPNGRLLDLGCGPGRVSIPLAPYFAEVWAVDPESEMLEEGQRRAGPSSAIQWITFTAEHLVAPDGSFDLITAGESFHRFDQRLVGSKAIDWLRQDGHIALLWQVNLWPGDQRWQVAAREIVNTYVLKPPPLTTAANIRQYPTFREALVAIGFRDVTTHEFESVHDWTVDAMIGFLYSTSILSIRMLGDRRSAFETDFRHALANLEKGDVFQESITFGYVLGRRLDANGRHHGILAAGFRTPKKSLTMGMYLATNVNSPTQHQDASTARIHLVQMDKPLSRSR